MCVCFVLFFADHCPLGNQFVSRIHIGSRPLLFHTQSRHRKGLAALALSTYIVTLYCPGVSTTVSTIRLFRGRFLEDFTVNSCFVLPEKSSQEIPTLAAPMSVPTGAGVCPSTYYAETDRPEPIPLMITSLVAAMCFRSQTRIVHLYFSHCG